MSRRHIGLPLAFALLAGTSLAQVKKPSISFTEVAGSNGFQAISSPVVMGTGVCAADVDDDGDVDLWVANTAGNPALYYTCLNNTFIERGADVGLDSIVGNRNGLWFDYDGDRDLDLLVANDIDTEPSSYYLYRNNGGSFTDVTAAAGLMASSGSGHRGGCAAGDINGDGWLDLYLAYWMQNPHVFLNDGDGTFTDITASSGVLNGIFNTQHQPLMFDFNDDGLCDIFCAVDFDENHLWINQGNNTFVDVAVASGVDILFNDMGATISDFDVDGDFDIYTTNVFRNIAGTDQHSVLLRNDGVLTYTEVSEQLGVDDGGWGWGITFTDADNDGYQDILGNNGWLFPNYPTDSTRFWHNSGAGPDWYPNGDQAATVGVQDFLWTSAVVTFDFDRDGDLDLFQTTMNDQVRLLRNDSTNLGNFLDVKPRMAGNNHRAIGATVRVTTTSHTQSRPILAGNSYLAQEPAEAFFGLGKATSGDVTVEFPGGTTKVVKNVPAGLEIEVTDVEPTTSWMEQGEVGLGHTLSMNTSNNQSLKVTNGAGVVQMRIISFTSTVNPTTVDITFEGGSTQIRTDLKVYVYNVNTQAFDQVATWLLKKSDQVFTANGLSAANYVDADGRIDVRLETSRRGGDTMPWEIAEFFLTIDHFAATAN